MSEPALRRFALCLLVSTACHLRPGTPLPARGGGRFVREVAPFPVLDARGRPFALPFLGGFEHPRPQLVDLAGGTHPDLFIQEVNGRLQRYRRDTAGAWSLADERFQGLDIGEWYRFVDVDDDGLPDLFTESPLSDIRYYHNAGTAAAPRFVVVADTLRDGAGAVIYADRQNIAQFADLDCNGKLDMMLGRVDGTITRYEMQGWDGAVPRFGLVTERFQDIQIIGQRASRHGANTLAVFDLDEDGDPDILWGDFFEAGLLWLRNNGSCASFDFHGDPIPFPPGSPLATSGYNAPAAGDLNGDGRLDLVVGVLGGAFNPTKTSAANLYRLDRTAQGWSVVTDRLLDAVDLGSESIPAFVDLDGDGDSDLVVGTKISPDDARRGDLVWFENVGTRTAPALRARGRIEVLPAFHYAPAFGDLDGDGRPDLVLGQFYAAVAWYRNAGVARFTLADSALVQLPRGSNAAPALVDADGDGDLDLFLGDAAGRIAFFRNDGSPTVPRFTLVTDDYLGGRVGRRAVPRFADVDGDGVADLIVGREEGALAVYLNRGTTGAFRLVADSGLGLDLPPYSAPAFADLHGTGRLELLVGGAGGGLLYFRR